MPTYRQHQDTRDGTIYNCVLMPDGKWWAAENLRWDGAGWDYANNPAHRPTYGRLYSPVGRSSLPPQGARLPSDSEWNSVVSSAGGPYPFLHFKDSALGWLTFNGDNSTGMSMRGGGIGSAISTGGPYFSNRNSYGYWLCSDDYYRYATHDGTGLSGPLEAESTDSAMSVRFIVDVFNEPIPHPSDFFPTPGTYENPQVVTLNKIGMLYTLDGTDPTPNSPTFDAPIRISGPTEIRLKSLFMPDVFSFSYLVKGRPLPTYKQAALWADGKASPDTITRVYNG